MAVKRSLQKIIQDSNKSVLLLGPRQAGKTTLLHSLDPDLVVDLASERQFFQLSSEPGHLESLLEANLPGRVLIDEIQRIPALLNTVQFWIDQQKLNTPPKDRTQFLISGSSARKLKRGQANLAPGRLRVLRMGGLAASELGHKLDCRKALAVGTLPEAYLGKNLAESQTLLRDYSATYLIEEIQSEALTRNLAGFSRYLLALAAQAGNVLDLSKSASKAKVSRSSAARFIEILEDTLIAERLPVYAAAGEADIIKHPKLFFFDPGVLNGLLENFTVSADRTGSLMEHLVYNQIRNSLHALDRRALISYFRTRNDVEVDFVVTLDSGEIWAIEVKAGSVSDDDIKPLLILKDYLSTEQKKKLRLAVVSPREGQKRMKSGCLILGLNELLEEMGL